MKSKYSFWKLLSEKHIVIPIIQRDYAQGREGKEQIRKNFLEQLGKALGLLPHMDGEQYVELDFVYGTEVRLKQSGDKEVVEMLPLDGQQRLTTLWLLHWYVAYKSQKLELSEVKDTLKKFSYETRSSSREFCEKLCDLTYNKTENVSIADYIKKQTWYFSAWNQDPTISSMLCMLNGTDNSTDKNGDFIDGIQELFNMSPNKYEYTLLWEKLTGDDCPIYFNFLPLQSSELPISDDLYIKMNARGKTLTNFENFKADWIKWIFNLDLKDSEKVEYASLIDNQWTDIFWKNGKEYESVDELYYAFLNRYLLNEFVAEAIDPQTNKYYTGDFLQKGVAGGKQIGEKIFNYLYGIYPANNRDDNRIVYHDFQNYEQVLSVKVLEDLKNIFSKFASIGDLSEFFPERVKEEKFFIPNYTGEIIEDFAHVKVKEISDITLEQRVVFYAICAYLKKDGEFDGTSFKRWMRIAWNIAENTNNDSTISRFVRSIRLIKNLSAHCRDIYSFLSIDENIESINSQLKEEDIKAQLKEETVKAKQILSKENIGPTENEIMEAENYAFFKGAIRFLYTNENKKTDWGDFSVKWENAQKYFTENGVCKSIKDAKLIRRLITYFNKENDFGQIYYDNKKEHWRNDVLLNENLKHAVHQLLRNNDIEVFKYEDYRSNIDTAKLKYVQEYLVQNTALAYIIPNCEYHSLDKPTLYPYNTKASWNKFVISQRNEILHTLKKQFKDDFKFVDNELNSPQYTEAKLLRGWDVGFYYKTHHFQWQWSDWVDMYDGDIKLWDKGKNIINEGKKEFGLKYQHLHSHFPKEIQGENNLYFYDVNTLINELNRCISEYEAIAKS